MLITLFDLICVWPQRKKESPECVAIEWNSFRSSKMNVFRLHNSAHQIDQLQLEMYSYYSALEFNIVCARARSLHIYHNLSERPTFKSGMN